MTGELERLRALSEALDILKAAPIRHRTDMYRLPAKGEPIPSATWEEYDAARPHGISPACDYLNRKPPRSDDCECGAFYTRGEEVDEARDAIIEAVRDLLARESAVPEPIRDSVGPDWLENVPKLNAPDATGQWHQWVKVEDIAARDSAGAGVNVELRPVMEQAVLLPEPTGGGWGDEVRMSKRDLHDLLNRHALNRLEVALAAARHPVAEEPDQG